MGKKSQFKWTDASYREALIGGDGIPGLRTLIKGFGANDGYDLRKISNLSTARKTRIRKYYADVKLLYAQSRRVVHTRNNNNLKRLHETFHGNIPSKQFKVALVPYVEPMKLPGVKTKKFRITYDKTGVVIHESNYVRREELFNQYELANNPQAEVIRVLSTMPDARLTYIRAGEFQVLNPKTGVRSLTDEVLRLISKYDGVTEFSRLSKKAGENPENHFYGDWLKGVIGFTWRGKPDEKKLSQAIVVGIQKNKELVKKRHSKIKRAK